MEAKLECGLRSVWNVITDMQNNIDPKRSSVSPPPPQETFSTPSPSQKTTRKSHGFASLLGWKS